MQIIGREVTVTVDRMLGTAHPRYPDIIYPINYGYVEGIMAPDEDAQDAYIIGIDRPLDSFSGPVIAVIHRYDDVEEKWVVAPAGSSYTREEIARAVEFQERFFDTEIIM